MHQHQHSEEIDHEEPGLGKKNLSCYKLYEKWQKLQNQSALKGQRAYVAKRQLWNEKVLTDKTIYFHILKKNPKKDAQVRKAFQTWKNIKIWLNFKDTDDPQQAQIKIKYGNKKDDYSYVGIDNLQFSKTQDHTMALGFGYTDRYFGTILHQIGHAIGLQHEHQNPFGGIKWNQAVVRQQYSNQTQEDLQNNIFQPGVPKSQAFGTIIDRESIMVYDFDPESFFAPADLKKYGTHSTGSLTDKDISFVKTLYPDPTQFFVPIKNNTVLQSKVAKSTTSLVIYFQNPTTDFFTLQEFKNSKGKIEDEPEKIIKWNSTSTWAFSGDDQTSGSLQLKSGLKDDVIKISWNLSSDNDGGMIDDASDTIKVQSGKAHKVNVSYQKNSTGFHTIARVSVLGIKQGGQPYHNFEYKK